MARDNVGAGSAVTGDTMKSVERFLQRKKLTPEGLQVALAKVREDKRKRARGARSKAALAIMAWLEVVGWTPAELAKLADIDTTLMWRILTVPGVTESGKPRHRNVTAATGLKLYAAMRTARDSKMVVAPPVDPALLHPSLPATLKAISAA